jgi:flagellar motor switch protein FliG
MMMAQEFISQGGIDYARDVLERALGTQKAIDIVNRLTSSLQVRPFDFIRRTDPSHLLNFIQGEHPQTIALILAYLDPQKAAQILAELPHNIQADVARRIAEMKRTSPDVLREVERVLERKLSTLASEDFTQAGGIDTIVEILNNVDRGTEKIIIEALEEEDPELAEEIKKRMFVFEDIVLLDDRSIQKVLREVDTQELAKALKGVDAEVQEKIFRNMSKRAASLLREDMDFMGPIRLRDVEESQQKIVNIIRKLEDAGDIVVARAGEEELVV